MGPTEQVQTSTASRCIKYAALIQTIEERTGIAVEMSETQL